MCGITGIYNRNGKNVDELSLKRMTAMLSHRGPDNEGFYKDRDIGLGHRRLSIIDLSESAKQPMSNENGSVWLVFNGCIYNYIELQSFLKSKGHIFKTKTDAEVILHAYEEFGVDCLQRFNGMFAIAIWDCKQKSLFLARDRIGIKPLYYSIGPDKILFASEIKSILEYDNFKKTPELDAIYDYLSFQFSLGDATFFKGIKKLKPAHYLVITKDNVKSARYWDIKFNYENRLEEDYAIQLKDLLYDSVRLRLRSDVSVGLSLSGGIDSSIVGMIATRESPKSITSFNGRFTEDPQYDESHYARLLAKETNIKYNEVIPSTEDFSRIFSDLIWHLDEPAGGPGMYAQHFIAKEASRAHVKVLLGGEGGDELFGGYHRYIRTYSEEIFIRSLKKRKAVLSAAKSIFSKVTIKELLTFLATRSGCDLGRRYYYLMNTMNRQKHFYMKDFIRNRQKSQIERFLQIFNKGHRAGILDKMLYFDFKVYLPALLHVDDRISMVSSVEARSPLLDYRIAELAFSIPEEIKIGNLATKKVLREAGKDLLPDAILNRKDKVGFNTPFKLWASRSLKSYIEESLNSGALYELGVVDKKKIDGLFKSALMDSNHIWSLLCLTNWHERYFK